MSWQIANGVRSAELAITIKYQTSANALIVLLFFFLLKTLPVWNFPASIGFFLLVVSLQNLFFFSAIMCEEKFFGFSPTLNVIILRIRSN